MKRALNIGIILFEVLLLLVPSVLAQEAQPPPEIEAITTLTHMIRWNGVAASFFIIAGAWLLLRFVDKLVVNLGNLFADRRLLLQKLSAFFHFGVYLVTIVVVVLLSFEVNREILAILGGTIALASGFALKDSVASLVAGVMIMLDRPFQVGDRVSFGGQYGDITAIGLRSVKLLTLDDNTVTIPNNRFTTDITSCGNYGVPDMQVVIDFHIGTDQDVHRARELIREATATSRYVYLSKPIIVNVSQVIIDSYIALRVKLKAYVLDTKYEKAFETDVTLRVLEAFSENGIQPPAVLHRSAAGLGPIDHNGLKLAVEED